MAYEETRKRYYEANKEAYAERSKAWYSDPNNKIHRRNTRYNINFEKLKQRQDNKCAICSTEFTEDAKAFIDHDHNCCSAQNKSCGRCVRGLICKKCNDGLVFFNENWETMESAAKYLFEAKVRYINGN